MDIDVRPYDGSARDFIAAAETAFGEHIRDDDAAAWEAMLELDRTLGTFDGDRLVGTAGAFSFDLTIPGGVLPAAGITMVGVQPTHRRKGALRRMMRMQLDDVHDRGEPLAILWASEGSIYQRFGYGLASLRARIGIQRDRAAFARPHLPAGSIRFVDVDEAKRLFPAVHDALLPDRPGFFGRTPAFWDSQVFYDPEHWRHGAGAAFHVVHEVDGVADGYARYRIRDEWDDSGPKSTLLVNEVLATNAVAHLDLWRYLLDVDLIGRIEAWNLPPDEPLMLAVLEPRRLGLALADGLWLRVVDVASALAGRRYRTDGGLTVQVQDAFCPWNEGRWSLRVEAGIPIVEPTDAAADIACDVSDVAAAYLGGFTFRQLSEAARVTELSPGGVARADALFATDRAPWCPRVF
ncbi:MAG: GNAT family N-acetyltransferase [Chloroflexi bacterium]|nr:GNAT family N-acetyltransferase [Chloroflexota bacterium]